MPLTRMSDNREFQSATVAEADQQFEQLAQLHISIKVKQAVAEKRIAAIKAKVSADTESDVEEYNELVEWLNSYVLANKKRFIKPRMRKTEFGKYGLRTATKLHVSDELKVIECSERLGLALFETKRTLNKKAVERALANGEDISGAKMVSGDIASFSVSKELLDKDLKR